MKKKFKKGFTLVELLVVIILLGVIGAIVIYNMTSVSNTSKDTDYKRYTSTIKSAAKSYASLNQDAFNELYVNKAYIYIKAGQLIKDGLLDENLKNPYTNKPVGEDELIKASLDTVSGNVVFDYPVNPDDVGNETSLVAMSDYVVWDEPYDCMRGAGTYELALADEKGDLILLTPENVEKYSFTCSFPDGFKTDDPNRPNVAHTTEPGNYDIEYRWISASGTRKKMNRTLRVESRVIPSFTLNDNSYNFKAGGQAEYYDNKYVYNSATCPKGVKGTEPCGTWNVLQYKPLIEGADSNTATFAIFKKTNGGNFSRATNYESVTGASDSDIGVVPISRAFGDSDLTTFSSDRFLVNNERFNTIVENNHKAVNAVYGYNATDHRLITDDSSQNNWGLIADDGDKNYLIVTKVKGHYDETYSYSAFQEYTIRVELQIDPTLLLSDGDKNYRTNHRYTVVKGTFSPVGINRYEFKLGSANKSNAIVEEHTFNQSFPVPDDTSNGYPKNEFGGDNPSTPYGIPTYRINDSLYRRIYAFTTSSYSYRCAPTCPNDSRTYDTIYFRAINRDGYAGEWTRLDTTLTNVVEYLSSYNGYGDNMNNFYLQYSGRKFVTLSRISGEGLLMTQAEVDGFSGNTDSHICPSSTHTWTVTFQTEDRTWTETYSKTVSSLTAIVKDPANWLDRNNISTNNLVWKKYTGITAFGGALKDYRNYNANLIRGSYWLPQLVSSGNNSYVVRYNNGNISHSYAGACDDTNGLYTLKRTAVICCGVGTASQPYVVAY